MPTKRTITFIEATAPIREPITKFGGQPVWLDAPQWPLSRETGNPMRFIAQIRLADVAELTTSARMAYLFMTEEEDGEFVDGTYEPDGGENAIILQPGDTKLPTVAKIEGPTLFRMAEQQREPCEFTVELIEEEDMTLTIEEANYRYENKLGGAPEFMQGEQFPFDEGSQFLLQIDETDVPFYINFGTTGIGYAFLNRDGTQAKFLWQC